jgi:hypothetical protein
MKPLFTIHAGELVTGEHLARRFRRLNLWVPAKDSGVDLLLSNATNTKTVSLQVKFSRDFVGTAPMIIQSALRASGWWKLDRRKIAKSTADYWVFVLMGFARQSTDFVVIKPKELLRRLDAIHGKQATFQTYLWVTKNKHCWETRGLRRVAQILIASGAFSHKARNFTEYLDDWSAVKKLS